MISELVSYPFLFSGETAGNSTDVESFPAF